MGYHFVLLLKTEESLSFESPVLILISITNMLQDITCQAIHFSNIISPLALKFIYHDVSFYINMLIIALHNNINLEQISY